jgi:hypothetical protein
VVTPFFQSSKDGQRRDEEAEKKPDERDSAIRVDRQIEKPKSARRGKRSLW